MECLLWRGQSYRMILRFCVQVLDTDPGFALRRTSPHVLPAFTMQQFAMYGFNKSRYTNFSRLWSARRSKWLSLPILNSARCKQFPDVSAPLAKLASWEFPTYFCSKGMQLYTWCTCAEIFDRNKREYCADCVELAEEPAKEQAQVSSKISIFVCLFLLSFFLYAGTAPELHSAM